MSSGKRVTLEVKGLGPTPSFKNNRRLFFTNPRNRRWMDECIRLFVSQFNSVYRTGNSATCPECLRQSVIASLPLDDNWQELEIGAVSCKLIEKGNEGATITIEPL